MDATETPETSQLPDPLAAQRAAYDAMRELYRQHRVHFVGLMLAPIDTVGTDSYRIMTVATMNISDDASEAARMFDEMVSSFKNHSSGASPVVTH